MQARIPLAIMLFASLGLTACGKDDEGDETKRVAVTLSLAPQSGSAALQGPSSGVTDLRLCFKRLRLKAAETEESSTEEQDDADADNVDFALGEVQVKKEGAPLGEVSVPEGSYRRVEIDLDKKCNGYSVKVTNAQGTFQSNDRVKIKFRGEFEAKDGQAKIALAVDGIVKALEAVKADAELRTAIQIQSGVARNE